MNVAIYGGSFDPPHLGHVMVATHLLLNDLTIDKIVIVPCFQQTGKNLIPFEDRFDMCQIAFGWLPRTQVSQIEAELGGESLTVRTLSRLHSRHPDWKMRFVMGTDLMHKAPLWEGWAEISALAPPLFVGRAGIAPTQPEDPTPISPAVSSTLVRMALRTGDYHEAERYLPSGVLQHIQTHSLYGKD